MYLNQSIFARLEQENTFEKQSELFKYDHQFQISDYCPVTEVDKLYFPAKFQFEDILNKDLMMEEDLMFTNDTPSYAPDAILECNDDIFAFKRCNENEPLLTQTQEESLKVLSSNRLISSEDTSEIFSDKKESSHFKSEQDEKFTNQSDKEDDDCGDSEEIILVPYEFQGDGRKREAKRHKSRTVIP